MTASVLDVDRADGPGSARVVSTQQWLNFTHSYVQARGWRARRIYVSLKEWTDLITNIHSFRIDPVGEHLFYGAVVYIARNQAVAEKIREWRARRIYVSLKEWTDLITNIHSFRIDPVGEHLFDGAVVRIVRNQAVAEKIREWDLCA